jgi:type IV secretory pathway TrbF-like protein
MGFALAPLQHTQGRRYATAGLAIAHHIVRARAQAAHWRLIGIGSATLCACLATLVVLSAHTNAVVHVVETPSFVTAEEYTRARDAKQLIVSVSYREGRDTR